MKPATIKTQVSSGGIIFRKNNGVIDVALVSVKGGKVWCLPKGIVDKGESPEKTAVREVSEETGLYGRIIEKLGEIRYWYYIKEENAKYRKTVYFFLMEYESGDVANHDWEVNSASWFLIDEAIKKVTYKNEKELLEKTKKIIMKHEKIETGNET